jgi:hypothetical protein
MSGDFAERALTIIFFRVLIPHNGGHRKQERGLCVADYRKLYHKMFNAATDAEILMSQAVRVLRDAQVECEVMYVETRDPAIELVDRKPEE